MSPCITVSSAGKRIGFVLRLEGVSRSGLLRPAGHVIRRGIRVRAMRIVSWNGRAVGI